MKRHESITALSRDHHFGLLFCWKIRQGIKGRVLPERMQPYVRYFLDMHLERHFQEEETLLFGTLQGDDLIEQALSEHKHIRELAEAVIRARSIEPHHLNTLADALDNHIRFEERFLFPYIEQELSEDKLAALGRELQISHQTRESDDYPDEFWV